MSLKDLHSSLYKNRFKEEQEKREFKNSYFDDSKEEKTTKQVVNKEEKNILFKETIDMGDSLLEKERKILLDEDKDGSYFDNKIAVNDSETAKKNTNKISLKTKIFIIAGATIGLIFIITLGVLFYGKYKEGLFDPERVTVEIFGSETADSGKNTAYQIKIANNNKVELNQAELKINFPKEMELVKDETISYYENNSASIKIEEIKAESVKEYEVNFNIFGAKDAQIYLKAEFKYQPEGFSSFFKSNSQKSLSIVSSALSVTLSTVKEASNGEIVQSQIIIQNKGSENFENIKLKMEYPEGFIFKESQPIADEKNTVWKFDKILPAEEIEVLIKGEIGGQKESIKKIQAFVGTGETDDSFSVFNQAESTIKIISPKVEILQTIVPDVKTVKAGDNLRVLIHFKNTSDQSIRDLILTEKIDSQVIDEKSFNVKSGFYDDAKKEITWKASQVPALKILNPQQEGEVEFNVKVKNIIPAETQKDKNFIIQMQPAIESLEISSPLGENKKIYGQTFSLKLKSKLILELTGNYNDGEIPNAGPIPVKTGEETTFTLRFSLLNTSNDLRDVLIYATLPSGITWKNNYLPQSSSIEFNQQTNELLWKVGSLSAGTGFTLPINNLAFQIGLTPSQYQEGNSSIVLINKLRATAFDVFTEEKIDFTFNEFNLSSIADY